ncbi:oligosaccharide flippase family protein [Bacillus mycoides]|uniref:oligosaccharide flippase family protein n=1 Tax=Bacillus mycoides TaxID=1405 RepID=UPI00164267A9|nr:oligosaccharide flippase family protein [Bacillus mycoides]
MNINVKNIMNNKQHPVWVLVQQIISRVFVGLKFLILARMLGPQAIGLISVALISLAIIESLTQLGIMESIVQREKNLSLKERDAVWTMQFLRGIIISLTLFIISPMLVQVFNAPESLALLYVIAMVPLFTNSISIGMFQSIRNRNYRDVSIIELSTIILDLIISIILIGLFNSPLGVVISQLIAQVYRSIFSHVKFKTIPKFHIDYRTIKEVNRYGRWIWGNSISSLINNQLDKILASKFLGTTLLGYYQMSQKFAQMGVTDISFALGQYFFPTLSKVNRTKKEYLPYVFFNMLGIISRFSIFTATYLFINSSMVILIILGGKWIPMVNFLKLMLISACLAAILSVSVCFIRAIGNPKFVTFTSYIQLGISVPLSILGIYYLGVIGLIAANIFTLLLSNIILLTRSLKEFQIDKSRLIFNVIYFSGVICSMYVISLLETNATFICSTLIYTVLVIREFLKLKVTINIAKKVNNIA